LVEITVVALACAAPLLLLLGSGCNKPVINCAQPGCAEPMAVSAHLHVPVSELVTATTTACWRTECITLVASNDAGADLDGEIPLKATDEPQAGGVLQDEGDGWSRIDTGFSRVRVEADGGYFLKPLPANGDDYRLTVKAADGTTLLDVDRSITYTVSGRASSCSEECLTAVISLYASSPSGACTAVACEGRVELHHRFADEAVARQARVTVCRNGRCAVGQGFGFAPIDPPIDGTSTSAPLRVRSSLSDSYNLLDVSFLVDGENASLTDGDRYTLTVEHLGKVLTSFEQAAVYETSFPNGSCDPYPCRRVRFEVP
jgi:hypothetical protein